MQKVIRPKFTVARRRLSWACLLVATLTVACGDEEGPRSSSLTYHDDIAPLLAENCVACHQPGAIAPFSLTGYDEVASRAAGIEAATGSRQMPPNIIDNSGECETYSGIRWLSDEQIDMVSRWVEDGAPEGDAPSRPPAPPPVGSLEGELVTATMAEPYLPPARGGDVYRCFRVPLDVERDTFVVGFDAFPGNRELVHHLTLWTFDPQGPYMGGESTNAASVAQLDAADDVPGWDCLALDLGVTFSGMPVLWTPGTPATHFPAGTGLPLRRGDEAVLQVHYHPRQGAEPDLTAVALAVEDEVEAAAQLILADGLLDTLFDGEPFAMAPGSESVSFTWEGDLSYMMTPPALPPPDELPPFVDLYAIYPHMHTAGSSWQADLVRDDDASCVARVPRYDFDWQQMFMYAEPVRMNNGDRMRVTCEYDTRSRTGLTLPGFQTSDEMCTAGVYIVPPPRT